VAARATRRVRQRAAVGGVEERRIGNHRMAGGACSRR
jgi:hypothetical protein